MENSKIRIGKDFNVFWAIHKIVDGQRQPYDLEGKKLQLYYRTSYGKVEVANWKVNSNSIEWRFRGKEQKYVDDYELILVENADQDGMVTVDTCNAFTLVAHSCEERINEAENIIIEVVTLESDVALAPVVKEVGGGASEEDIQEIKNDIVDLQLKDVQTDAKLTELSEETNKLREGLHRGNFPNLTSGFASNLVGRGDSIEANFSFRPSGGKSIGDGSARVTELLGNTILWNQYRRKENWFAQGNTQIVENGEQTIVTFNELSSRFYTSFKWEQNHKYLISLLATPTSDCTIVVETSYGWKRISKSCSANALNIVEGVFDLKEGTDSSKILQVFVSSGAPVSITIERFIVCDLTKMFGADNEPSTIQEFFWRIPVGIDYKAYNEGKLISCAATRIKTIGFNAYNGTYARVLGGETYYINGEIDSLQYSLTLNGAKNNIVLENNLYTPLCDGYIFASGTNICINISHTGYKNGEYKPYKESARDVDNRIVGSFVGGMKSCGSVSDRAYNRDGKGVIEQHIGEVDLGELNWAKSSSYNNTFFVLPLTGAALSSNAQCDRYKLGKIGEDKSFRINPNGSTLQLFVTDSLYADVASFKAAMSGVKLQFELSTPIVTEFDTPFNFDYEVEDFGTEEILSDGASSALRGMIRYQFNAVDEVRNNTAKINELANYVGYNVESEESAKEDYIYCEKPRFAEVYLDGDLPTDISDNRESSNMVLRFLVDGRLRFKTNCKVSIQGQGSANYAKHNWTLDLCDANWEEQAVKFGNMPALDSYHLKGYYSDRTHSRGVGGAAFWRDMMKQLGYPYSKVNNKPLNIENGQKIDSICNADARYCEDGFPVAMYHNGEFYGLYTIKTKKHRKNYAMQKAEKDEIFLDSVTYTAYLQEPFDYADWEVKNPKLSDYDEGQPINDVEVLSKIERLFGFLNNLQTDYENHAEYIVLENWLVYIIFGELTGNTDISGNNMNLLTWDGTHWSIIPYDLDMTMGLKTNMSIVTEQEGRLLTAPFFNQFYGKYTSQIKALYKKLRESGFISEENIYSYYMHQVECIPREVYELDFKKWANIVTNGVPTMEQIYAYIHSRIVYLDSIWLNS